MSKHTPGPWEAEIHSPDSTFEIYGTKENGGALVIAARSGHASRSQEMAANARLIAAAPDLLDALNDLLSDVGRANSMPGAVKARAAIAKATGAQP